MIDAQINSAIAAHGTWKLRLADAIDKGTFEMTAEQVAIDNRCAFGTWLHGTDLSAADKTTDSYSTVLKLHAQFHREAAAVLRLALAGKKEDAKDALAPGSTYAHTSAELTRAMMAWRTRAAA